MNDFLKDLGSAHFWLSVVLVGVLMNLASDYLKPFLDRIGSRLSEPFRRKIEKQSLAQNDRIGEMANDEHAQVLSAVTEVSLRVQGLQSFIFGFAYLVLVVMALAVGLDGFWPKVAAGVLSLYALREITAGMRSHVGAQVERRLVTEARLQAARERLGSPEPSSDSGSDR
jgi:hypothetical protein